MENNLSNTNGGDGSNQQSGDGQPEFSGQPQKSWTTEYYEAVKAGLQRIWLNRYLWFWGLFLPAGFGLNFNYNMNENEKLSNDQTFQEAMNEFGSFVSEYWAWIAVGVAAFFVLTIIFWLLSAIARSGVTKAIDQLQNPTKAATFNFKEVWRRGKEGFGQILLVDVFVGVSLFLIMVILALPVVSLAFQGQYVFAGALAILALLIYIPLLILGSFLKMVGVIFCALSKMKAFKAVELAYGYVKTDFKEALKMILTTIILGFLQSFVVIAVVISLAFVVLILALFSSLALGFEEIFGGGNVVMVAVLVGVFALAVFVAILFLKAFFSLWFQDLWIWWTKRVGALYDAKEKERVVALEGEVKQEAFTSVE